MKISEICMYPVFSKVIPIEKGGIAPYRGSKDVKNGVSTVTSVIYKVKTDENIIGWGEMNMIITLNLTRTIFNDVLLPAFIGQDVYDFNLIKARVDSLYNPDINMLHFMSGLEIALWDIKGKAAGQPIYKLLGGAIRPAAPIAYAIGMMEDAQTIDKIAQIKSEGYRTVKTKGGNDLNWDIHRAHFMRELVDDSIDIRVDMNQGYNLVQAVTYLSGVKDCQLQYVEQPIRVNDLNDYRNLRERCCVPIALNEDCYIPGGLFNAIHLNALDAGVVDMESIGGISELIKLSHIAEAANLPLAHHCAWDMGIKTAAIVHSVCALKAFELPMDSTYHSHAEDPLATPITMKDGAYLLPQKPGLGVEIDEEKLLQMNISDSTLRYVF